MNICYDTNKNFHIFITQHELRNRIETIHCNKELSMKIKYKKMLLLLTTCAMGIGMVTLSFSLENKMSSDEPNPVSIAVQPRTNTNDVSAFAADPVVSVAPTATPEPKNELELNKYADINKVVKEFYEAKLTCSEEDFIPIVTNANQLDMERLQRKIEYVNSYQNINCYTKKGINEIDYVVYVSYDLELATIDTYAPSIDELRITYVDGSPKVYLGTISEETSEYLKKLRTSEDVEVLVSDVVTRLDEACASDENLNEFYQNIQKSSAQAAKENTESQTNSVDTASANPSTLGR